MSDGKNTLKLPGYHTDLNLNQKIILLPLLDAQKSIYTKKTVPETFDSLISFVLSNISVRHKIQGNKRIYKKPNANFKIYDVTVWATITICIFPFI